MDASSILKPVCEWLMKIAYGEYALVSHVKEDIQKLRSFTVPYIEGVLQDAEGKLEDRSVRTLHGTLKQALFDYEDIVDEVATKAALQERDADSARLVSSMTAKVCNVLCSCFGAIDDILVDRKIAHQIKDVRTRLEERSREIEALGLRSLGGSSKPINSRPERDPTSSMLFDESEIIGRDDEKEKTKKLLLEFVEGAEGTSTSKHFRVISIIGMGGLGKTTLVKLVYNDPTVVKHFQVRMWVYVSNYFDVERIKREIMDEILTSEEREEFCTITNWNKIQKMLKEKIEGKRFLLVLDDMWEDNYSKWESLIEPLSYGDKESKIVVTTRSQKVSVMVKGNPVLLENLSREHLWLIFERYAFEGCDSGKRVQLEPLGEQIVVKLQGSPLAAKVVGRLLNSNLDVMHWESILNSKKWVRSSDTHDILPILKLSYDHLPGHLKQCFAYCSLFPEDYPFSKDGLVDLWMAQNFIQIPKGFHAQVALSQHFNDLLHASFFQQSRSNRFVMHDLIHDLAESVSADDCFRLDIDESKKIPETVRHVSIVDTNFDPTWLKEVCKHEKLRTLLFFYQCQSDLSPHLDELFLKLHRLRALGLHWCKIKELPESIGNLIHLRYIDLSYTDISKLPESICNLHNLQVLMLQNCGALRALPSNMSALINLRHLRARCELVSNIQGLRQLTALQELSISGRQVKELVDMRMLKELEICDLDQVEVREEVVQGKLDTKEYLEVLKLTWDDDRDDHLVNQALDEEVLEGLKPQNRIRELSIAGYGGLESPGWIEDHSWASTSSLKILKLKNCRNWEVLPALGQLPSLKTLSIRGMHEVRQMGPYFFGCGGEGGSGGFKAKGFPSLEELTLSDMPEWEEWLQVNHVGGVDYMLPQQQPLFLPCLRTLEISDCPKLRELPPLPPTLTRLEITEVGLTRLPGWSGCHDGGGDVDGTPSLTSPAPSLSSLHIFDCPNIKSLGDGGLLQHPLPVLERLHISLCPQLASLPDRTFSHLTSLKSLTMTRCPKLPWPPSVAPEGDDALPPSLESVEIYRCGDMMVALLSVATLQKLTSLRNLSIGADQLAELRALTSLTHLEIQDDDGHLDDGALSTCLLGLISLRALSINNSSVMTSLPSVEVLSHLTALELLRIDRCSELTSLGGAPALVSLEALSINKCPKLLHLVEAATSPKLIHLKSLEIFITGPQQIVMWLRQCPSLKRLEIWDCPELTCFDDNGGNDIGRELDAALLNLAPSLRQLQIRICENLCSLPSNLRFLSSLEELGIYDCPQIQSLPGAGLPESLEFLHIAGCRALEERCKEGGTDWPLISHVPQVILGWED